MSRGAREVRVGAGYRRRPLIAVLGVLVGLTFGAVQLQLLRAYSETAELTHEFKRTTDATTVLANVQREILTLAAEVARLEDGDELDQIELRRALLERQLEVFDVSASVAARSQTHRNALRSWLPRLDAALAQLGRGSRARGAAAARPQLMRVLDELDLRAKVLFDEWEQHLYDALTFVQHGRGARQRLLVFLGAFGLLMALGATFLIRRSVRRDFERAYESLAQEVTERTTLQEKLSHQATHDALTGLSNRARFRDELHRAARDRARSPDMAVVYLDLDGFKSVNDSLGHAAGDALLMLVAERLQHALRPDDLVARLGGDEFAVLLRAPGGTAGAARTATRLLEVVQEPFDINGKHATVGVSVGIAMAPDGPLDAEELIRNADLAMYSVKNADKGSCAFFDQQMGDVARERVRLEAELRDAIANGEFELHYQPVVDARREQPVGFEALLRWRHPTRGLLGPGAFMDVAEEAGVMVSLSRWSFERACADAAAWPEPKGGAPLWVSVNVSPRQLKDPHLVSTVRAGLVLSGLDEHRLMVEISEMTMLSDQRGAAPVLAELRALGVRIALDDFGAGYSSLGHLRFLPLDVLKIDRCFVEQLGGSSDGARLSDAVLRLGSQIHVESIVEGVERPDQLEALRRVGCEFAQGYLFSAAVPGSEVAAMIAGEGSGLPLRAAS